MADTWPEEPDMAVTDDTLAAADNHLEAPVRASEYISLEGPSNGVGPEHPPGFPNATWPALSPALDTSVNCNSDLAVDEDHDFGELIVTTEPKKQVTIVLDDDLWQETCADFGLGDDDLPDIQPAATALPTGSTTYATAGDEMDALVDQRVQSLKRQEVRIESPVGTQQPEVVPSSTADAGSHSCQ